MSHSFITPRLKPIFSLFSKLWIAFIGFSIAIMVIFDLFILYGINSHASQKNTQIKTREEYNKKIESNDAQIAFIRQQKAAAETVYASNSVLRDSMQNLFDLVPDQITLSRIIMEKNSLILYGQTPSKDTFNFLLASPLRSIFHTSNTVFYLNEDGWYRFISTNKILDSDGFNE